MARLVLRPAGLLVVVAMALFLGPAAWGWGGWGPLLAHPARAGACAATIAAAVAIAFTDVNARGLRRPDTHGSLALVPLAILGVILTGLPAYCDRRNLVTIDGDATRYVGLALLLIGCVLRIGPMFVLGGRFTWPLASQEPHRLETTGFYRHVRHPSYLGAVLWGLGWALVFRSLLGVALMALEVVLFHPIIAEEEALLSAEFGDDYAAYRRRTWRLVPFLY
ncbi:MAG TPA: isoprenylcysteine carboxylmethyltransferase family protein [Isosphaeraceae bacterium]|jgi:protein-S-isoprenylcysteine O-methyltransferase Ste14|nr:isoprenylcysteine carboxylmethyltransferase family protein [Isosphaeraceae bacterium]